MERNVTQILVPFSLILAPLLYWTSVKRHMSCVAVPGRLGQIKFCSALRAGVKTIRVALERFAALRSAAMFKYRVTSKRSILEGTLMPTM